MSELTDPAPADATRKKNQQDKTITAYITAAEKFLGIAAADPDIAPLLAARGYDAADFTEGRGLVTAARSAVADRADGMGKQSLKTGELHAAINQARDDYARFREIARPSFPDHADRLALSLTGEVPDDTGRFITLALASYSAASKAPRADKLVKRGYSATILNPLIASLNALIGVSGDQDQALGDAIGDTAARDAAYDALHNFMKELKGVAKGALRGNHALLAKLAL